MSERVKTRSRLWGAIVGIVVFLALSATALPRLETSLTFKPILAISVIAGALSGFLASRRSQRAGSEPLNGGRAG